MSFYILDTDHVTLFQRGHSLVRQQVTAVSPSQLAVTIISFEEQIRGRLAQVHRAKTDSQQIIAYLRLRETLTYYSQIRVLDFDEKAIQQFQQLRQQKIRVGTQDLRIASIALVKDGTLITRNQRDFSQIPSLKWQDWSA